MAELDKDAHDIRGSDVKLLDGKNAIITGCARGIGNAMLKAFAQNGANVWACCRKPTAEFEALTGELSDTYGVWVRPLYFDLMDTAAMKEAVKMIMAAKAPVDILVNNAGVTYNALFQMTSLEKLREVLEINFFSQLQFSQYIVKLMVRQKYGSIVNVTSTAALDANPGRSGYGASKSALLCMTRAMAHELAEQNIRVNAIAPGITATDMVQASMTDEAIETAVQATRLKRMGDPAEIADAAVFLGSELSSYVTGEVIRVDGGLQN
jgi:3-oxoacyl-[acyl-carrier protein] reductase